MFTEKTSKQCLGGFTWPLTPLLPLSDTGVLIMMMALVMIFILFGNEIISMEHHYNFHSFSFEPLSAIASQLQSITVPFCKLQ